MRPCLPAGPPKPVGRPKGGRRKGRGGRRTKKEDEEGSENACGEGEDGDITVSVERHEEEAGQSGGGRGLGLAHPQSKGADEETAAEVSGKEEVETSPYQALLLTRTDPVSIRELYMQGRSVTLLVFFPRYP